MLKNSRIFILLLALVWGGISFVSANKYDDFSYFFHQSDKISSPKSPWIQNRPRTVDQFLAPENSAFRNDWRREPRVTEYKFHRSFDRSKYEFWRNLDLRGYSIKDTEDLEGSFCTYRDSVIGNQWLDTYQIEGRCCVCSPGGVWQCEYKSVDADRQCKQPDLDVVSVELREDETFQTSDAKRFLFSGRIRNAGEKISNDFRLTVFLGEQELGQQTFSALSPNESISFSQLDFPNMVRGIVLPAGEYEIVWEVENLEQEEGNIENNRVVESVLVSAPQIDFGITQINAVNTDNQDENGRKEVSFQVGIQNFGDYVAEVPASFIISVFSDPDFPPVYEETVSRFLYAPQSMVHEFLFFIEPGQYSFGIQVSSEKDDMEKTLENNVSDLYFTVE